MNPDRWKPFVASVRGVFAVLGVAAAVALAGCSGGEDTELEKVREELSGLKDEVRALREEIAALGGDQDGQRNARQAQKVSRVSFDDNPRQGSDSAKVAIVEFSDYQCPYCGRFHQQTLPRIRDEYVETGKVALIYRDFPLANHPQAKPAAVTANCAGEQGEYWAAQKRLFDSQNQLGDSFYESLAGELGLDRERFTACLDSDAQAEEVQADFEAGRAAGVRGTPTFFIGRIEGDAVVDATKLTGAQPFARFRQAIDSLLGE